MFKLSNSISTFRAQAKRIAALAIALSALTGLASAEEIQTYEAGSWSGSAYTKDNGEGFSHCVFLKSYPNGRSLLFGVSADKTWSFGFGDGNWKLKKGRSYPVRYKIDGGETYKGTARVKNKYMVQVQLPLSKPLMHALRSGNELAVRAGKSTLRFELADMPPMIKKLFTCAKNHIVAAKKKPDTGEFEPQKSVTEFEGDEAPDARRFPSAQTRKESRTAVKYLLKMAGVRGRFKRRKAHPHLYKTRDAVWKMKGMVGTFRIMPERDLTPDSIVRRIRAADEKTCKGSYAAGKVLRKKGRVHAFMSMCADFTGQAGDTALSVYYTLLPRREGGHYLLSVIGRSDDANRVEAMGIHLRDTAVALNAKGSVPGARPIS